MRPSCATSSPRLRLVERRESLRGTVGGSPDQQLRELRTSERTVFAWLVGAVSLTGLGVIVSRIDSLVIVVTPGELADGGWTRWSGAALLLAGSVVGLFGAWRTRTSDATIVDGDSSIHHVFVTIAALDVALALWILFLR